MHSIQEFLPSTQTLVRVRASSIHQTTTSDIGPRGAIREAAVAPAELSWLTSETTTAMIGRANRGTPSCKGIIDTVIINQFSHQ